jgi:hypothetical protein
MDISVAYCNLHDCANACYPLAMCETSRYPLCRIEELSVLNTVETARRHGTTGSVSEVFEWSFDSELILVTTTSVM